jgi:hypothetical protein
MEKHREACWSGLYHPGREELLEQEEQGLWCIRKITEELGEGWPAEGGCHVNCLGAGDFIAAEMQVWKQAFQRSKDFINDGIHKRVKLVW